MSGVCNGVSSQHWCSCDEARFRGGHGTAGKSNDQHNQLEHLESRYLGYTSTVLRRMMPNYETLSPFIQASPGPHPTTNAYCVRVLLLVLYTRGAIGWLLHTSSWSACVSLASVVGMAHCQGLWRWMLPLEIMTSTLALLIRQWWPFTFSHLLMLVKMRCRSMIFFLLFDNCLVVILAAFTWIV